MKSIFRMTAGLCASAVGAVLWHPQRTISIQDLAHRLDLAWSDRP